MPNEVCMICLEAGADVPAPCQKEGLLFHARCLSMAWAAAPKRRCPHCNEAVDSWPLEEGDQIRLATHKLEGILQQWFQGGGSTWKQIPRYVKTKDGLLTKEENERVLAEMQKVCMEVLRPSEGRWTGSSDEATWTYTCTQEGTTSMIRLTRTALVDPMGRFVQDGYSVAAERRG